MRDTVPVEKCNYKTDNIGDVILRYVSMPLETRPLWVMDTIPKQLVSEDTFCGRFVDDEM